MTSLSVAVPFSDFAAQVAALRPQIDAAIARVLDRGWFILGPEVEAFESEFAQFLGVKHVVAVANGTDAIQLALMAAGIGHGDEVICPALTAAPTALAILHAGARPVFADIDPLTYTMHTEHLADLITPATKAIVPVHLYGLPSNMPQIMEIARAHHLLVIEDVAQAHGAMIGGQMVGTMGDMACFSFYPTKNLGGYGDGGAIATNDDEQAQLLRQLRNLGQRGRFEHVSIGLNSRLDDLQAAILRVHLAHLAANNSARRQLASAYQQYLADLDAIILPQAPPEYHHVYHLYVIRTQKRDALQAYLRSVGVGTDVHYPRPLHRQPVFAHLAPREGVLKHAEWVTEQLLSLPLYPLLNQEQVQIVAEHIRAFLMGRAK